MPSQPDLLPLAGRIEIFRQRLVAIAEQMGETLARTAYSANIKERRDHSAALFGSRGDLLAQAAHIPVHLGSMPDCVSAVLAALRLGPGDEALLNDPYAGGTHLPDITLVSPVCVGGRVVGYAANRAHHSDVGGIVPGSMGVTTHIDQEGVRLPPTLWFAAGREDRSERDRLLAAVRTPNERLGDLQAQRAANAVGQRGLAALIERTGARAFDELASALRDYAERLMRRAIESIPRGIYESEDFLDGDGVSPRPIRIAVRLTVEDDRIVADFEGTDAQASGCINCPLAVTRSAVAYVFACLAGPRLPHNAGMFAPLVVRAPRGSVVNAVFPAAVAAGNTETSQRIVDVAFAALSRAVPRRFAAGSSGTMMSVSLGADDPHGGGALTFYETVAGGSGASAAGPGASAVHTHMTNTLNTPIEALESSFPVRVRRYEVRQGSGGAGRHRGGDGVIREIEALVPLHASVLADRASHGGRGAAGGQDGSPLRVTHVRGDGSETELPSKAHADLSPGDRLRIETPGGGGYGPPPRKKKAGRVKDPPRRD